ncbi:MAG: transporter substrate-binding domain-containing protein [Marinobacter sp.]|nr:transporter substrate-binding domain-containing protein [Marinobacter sp.]
MRRLTLLASVALLVLHACSAFARVPDRELVINISDNGYPPFAIRHDDDSVSGIMWDVLHYVALTHGYQLTAREIPPNRVDDFILSGELDGTMRAIEWTTNPSAFIFTDPVVYVQDVIYTRRGSPPIENVEQLSGTRLLARLGFHYPELKDMIQQGHIRRFDVSNNEEQLNRLRLADRFDALIINNFVAEWELRNQPWRDELVLQPIELSVTGYRFMFAPQHSEFVEKFNSALHDMKAQGVFERILDKYR